MRPWPWPRSARASPVTPSRSAAAWRSSRGSDEIVVPSLFEVEVVAALVRRGADPARVAQFFEQHFALRTVVTLGPRAARGARVVAGVTRLRAADALYVWLAAREGLPLVTADAEVLQRAALAGAQAVAP
jgi:predicted nucleic acid-binding protein